MSVTITIPFSIDITGAVATTTSEGRQLLDRVQAVVATLPGDRVMRPTYGVNTTKFLFQPSRELAEAEIRDEIAAGVARWEPSAVVRQVTFTINEALALVDASVQIARSDIPGREQANTRTVTVERGGTVSESPN